MSSLVSAVGSSFSGTLAATSAFTYTSSTTLLSATPVAGDYVFVAVWLTRATATTAVQNANGTYGSVKCGTVFLTCMENTSVPTSLSGTTTTNFHAYNAATTIANNTPNLAIFGAPYTSGMSRQIVVTGYNSSANTAILLVTAMAVQGIYTPASNPRTTWCNTISAGGVIDATSGSGLGWTSNGTTPSLTNFGSTKVNNSNLTSAIVDDVSGGAFTGVLNLGSGGYQSTQLSTRYANQQGLYNGELSQWGILGLSGTVTLGTTSSNNPIPPDLSGGPSTYTGGKWLAVGQAVSGQNIPRDTFITGFSYSSNFFGVGPAWFINLNNIATTTGTIFAGTEQPVLSVMLTNNLTTAAASTSVGNVTGTPNNGLTSIDPQGATNYVTTAGQSSGVVATTTNTALPTSGKMTVPTYGGNATMSWTSKPSSTTLGGCTVPATPSDQLLYQVWLDNVITPTVYWDNTPVLSSGSTQSVAPAIETPSTITAIGTTGFQMGTLVMTYGANRSGINPVGLYGLLRSNGGTNFGYGVAYAFQPNKAAIIGTVSEQIERDVSESSGASRVSAQTAEVVESSSPNDGGAPRTLPRTNEISQQTPTENASATSKAKSSSTSEIPTNQNGAASHGINEVSSVAELANQQNIRASVMPKTSEVNSAYLVNDGGSPLTHNEVSEVQDGFAVQGVRAATVSKSGAVAQFFTSQGVSGKVRSVLSQVASSIVTLVSKAFTTNKSGAVAGTPFSENIKSTALSRTSKVNETPTSQNQKARVASKTGAVAEKPTTAGTRATTRSAASAVAKALSVNGIKSIIKTLVSEVVATSSGENSKSASHNTASSVAEKATTAAVTSKTLSRSSSVFEALLTTGLQSAFRTKTSAVAEKPNSENTKAVTTSRASEVVQNPSSTSQRVVSKTVVSEVTSYITTTVSRIVTYIEVGAVAERIFTTAFAILNKLAVGLKETFTEYSKTEGFAEKTTTLSFRDDGVASYTERQ